MKSVLIITAIAKSKITNNYLAIVAAHGGEAKFQMVTTTIETPEAEFIIKNTSHRTEETTSHTIHHFTPPENIKL